MKNSHPIQMVFKRLSITHVYNNARRKKKMDDFRHPFLVTILVWCNPLLCSVDTLPNDSWHRLSFVQVIPLRDLD